MTITLHGVVLRKRGCIGHTGTSLFLEHANRATPLPSQPRVHKWAGSTTGWVLCYARLWNSERIWN